jgi:hypothetical protein
MIRGFIDELTERFPRNFRNAVDEIETPAEREIDGLLRGLTDTQLDKLLETIRVRRGQIGTDAAYGNEVVSISKQVLAFGGAGIGLVAAAAPKLSELSPLILKLIGLAAVFYLNLTGLSLFTILRFVWVSRFRYPFLYLRKIGNAAPFFYYQAISPEVPRSIVQTAEEKLKAVELYASDFLKFAEHLVPRSSSKREVGSTPENDKPASDSDSPDTQLKRLSARDELQQYFLIISYQGYVNQFEVRMNNEYFYGMVASVAATVFLAVWILR